MATPLLGRVIGVIGLFFAALSIGWTTSPQVGALFGIGVGVIWIASPSIAFGAAHIGLIAVPSLGIPSGLFAVEGGLLLTLVGPVIRGRLSASIVGATAAAFIIFLIILWVGIGMLKSVPMTAVGVAFTAVSAGYILDRYLRIRLGLIGSETEP